MILASQLGGLLTSAMMLLTAKGSNGGPLAKHLLIDPRVVDAPRTHLRSAEVTMGAAQKHGEPLAMEDQPRSTPSSTCSRASGSTRRCPDTTCGTGPLSPAVGPSAPTPPGTSAPGPTARPVGTGQCDNACAVPKGMACGSFRPFSAAILYAESADGINFTKPSLNLTAIGSKVQRGTRGQASTCWMGFRCCSTSAIRTLPGDGSWCPSPTLATAPSLRLQARDQSCCSPSRRTASTGRIGRRRYTTGAGTRIRARCGTHSDSST